MKNNSIHENRLSFLVDQFLSLLVRQGIWASCNKLSLYEIIFKKRFFKVYIYRIIKANSFFDLEEEITW